MTGGRQPKYGTSLVGFLLTNNRRPRPDAMTAPEANSPWIGLRQSFGAWSPSGRYSSLSSIGIAGSALRDGSTIFSKSTSRGECRSASSVSGREPSPAADSSEDQRSSRLPPPPFSMQLTLNGRSKPIPRKRRNWCDCLGISSASSACRNAISSKGDPGASDRLLLALAGRHARQTPLSNVAQAALTHVVGVGLRYLVMGMVLRPGRVASRSSPPTPRAIAIAPPVSGSLGLAGGPNDRRDARPLRPHQ